MCAPAGSGKTTLLADWARTAAEDVTVAWVTVDDTDEPVSLTGLVARALIDTGHPRMQHPCAETTPITVLLGSVPERVWIILDDAHLLHHPESLSELETLIRDTPRNVRIVVCGRFEPPLALQKLRLDGRVVDITFDDLAFTSDEAAILLDEHDVRLTPDDLAALMARTEGWAAGLRLAGMSLENHPDPTRLIDEFTGCCRAVADYLIEQVLRDLPTATRDFLVRTSVPATFTIGLAEQLTDCPDAHTIVDELERRNFLIGRIEGTPTRFRYHPLLRSYLQAEIGRLGRRAVTELEHVTSRWYAQFGEALSAVEHAVAAENVRDVTSALRDSGLGSILDGHGAALERLLAGTPHTIREQPIVRVVRAAAHLQDRNPVVAAELFEATIPDPRTDIETDAYTAALTSAVRLHLAVERGRAAPALAQDAAVPVSGDPVLASYRFLQRGRARLHLGLLDQAEEDLHRAAECARGSGSPRTERHVTVELALLHLCRGTLTDAHACTALGGSRPVDVPPDIDTHRTALADALVSYLRNDLPQATTLATTTMDATHGSHDPIAEESACAAGLYRIDLAVDRRAAVTALHTVTATVRPSPCPPGLVAATLPSVLCSYLNIGETNWGRELVGAATATLGHTGDTALLDAILRLYAGRLERARAMLQPVLDGELTCAAATNMVTARLVDAEIARRRGHDVHAHESLSRAMELAEPERILRPFHDMTPAVRELSAVNRSRFGVFADTVRESLPRTSVTTAEPLTRRELELLAELPTWRTAEEIAADLCVSINTVKTHLRGIYRKLGVSTRREAVTAAQSSGLLR